MVANGVELIWRWARLLRGFNEKYGMPDRPDGIADGTDAMGVIFLHNRHQSGRNAALTPPHPPSGKRLCWVIPVLDYSRVELFRCRIILVLNYYRAIDFQSCVCAYTP